MAKKKKRKPSNLVGFIGVGLDNQDGEKRLTCSDTFVLLGGSHDTHERMQDVAVKVTKVLRDRGQTLPDTPLEEVIEILHKAHERS